MNFVSLDKDLFLFVNSFVGKIPLFDGLIKLVVNEYFVPVTLSLVILYLWFVPGKFQGSHRKGALIAFYSIIAIALLIASSNQFIIRERPFAQLPTNLLFYKPTDPSFPSNAAAVGFALATAIFLVNRKFGVFALVLSSLYAFSRVYAGVHFPSDVVAGAIIGVLVTLAVARFTKFINFSTNLVENIQKKFKLELD